MAVLFNMAMLHHPIRPVNSLAGDPDDLGFDQLDI